MVKVLKPADGWSAVFSSITLTVAHYTQQILKQADFLKQTFKTARNKDTNSKPAQFTSEPHSDQQKSPMQNINLCPHGAVYYIMLRVTPCRQ